MNDNRPKNLDITTFNYPLPAITSLLHRLSGAFIFIGVALMLYLLELSLQSESGFALVQELLSNVLIKFMAWAVLAGLLYHLIAGIKHLLMDLGFGETLRGGFIGACITLALSAVAIIVAGVWIW
ncbi:MAG: succinate dehydrogenase, cytochrome b556 subunit [Gammaproteobacteria bacterium]|nr:succinate dehydrogenase, cytochrome b556 subunit [Gammaproteobacteria bacterium]MDG2338190.1 succinate dehydrogenase, cytochrome b556 subunit [Gammaproteobacteria bacterium]